MFLSRSEILKEREAGNILIDPFDPAQLNPNSYDVRLGPILKLLTGLADMKQPHEPHSIQRIEMPEYGYLLTPGSFYLGCTFERAGSNIYVPMLDGKSGVARTGLEVHVSAGFGDTGFTGRWTLEISVKIPTRVYPFQRIGQVSFHAVKGDVELYKGSYDQTQNLEPHESHIFKTMERDADKMAALMQQWEAGKDKR